MKCISVLSCARCRKQIEELITVSLQILTLNVGFLNVSYIEIYVWARSKAAGEWILLSGCVIEVVFLEPN
jgi:hypothetical protein